MSIDNVETKELKALSSEKDPPPKNQCGLCNGNGVIAVNENIVTCPKCLGAKTLPDGNIHKETPKV